MKMDFSEYKNFRSIINSEYGEYYDKYPYAFLALDYLIQLKVYREHNFEEWIDDSIKKDFNQIILKNIVKGKYLSSIYYFYINLFSKFFKLNNDFRIHLSIDESIFPGLQSLIKDVADKNNWSIINHGSFKLKELLEILLLKRISPYRCFLSVKTKKQLSHLISDDESILNSLLNDDLFMSDLDALLKTDVARTERLIKQLRINLFINTGDSSANGRVLNFACENANIKTISFAHGFIQDSVLSSIAPIRSNKLIVWTPNQKSDITKVLEKNQSDRVECIGFPKSILLETDHSTSQHDSCLILMSYMRDMLEDANKLAIFEKAIFDLRRFTKTLKIRLHPQERENKNIKKFIKKMNLEISQADLVSEIRQADFFVGAATSALVEAAASGKKVFEIAELSHPGVELEGVVQIQAGDILKIPDLSIWPNVPDELKHNKEELTKNLNALIHKLKTRQDSKKVTLILAPLLTNIWLDKEQKTILESVISELKLFSDQIKIRLHPLERLESEEQKDFFKSRNIAISDAILLEDIKGADVILGWNTSTLVEVASGSRTVYVIDDFPNLGRDFEGVHSISISEIHKIPFMETASENDAVQFCHKTLEKNLTNLIHSVSNITDEYPVRTKFDEEIEMGERFEFGKNWSDFLSELNQNNIMESQRSLLNMLQLENLNDKRFLDIGSGSGLSSLAARKSGAEVVSFDFDPSSVACTNELRSRYFPEDKQWDVQQGSILDKEYLDNLGIFDVVYSWGVLHHTGDMYTAMEHAAALVKQNGVFFIAIYNDQGVKSKIWLKIKEIYCSGFFGKCLISIVYIPYFFFMALILSVFIKRENIFKGYVLSRGMSITHDWIDWLGGLPFAVAKVEDILHFANERGFILRKLSTTNGLGNNQYVFVKKRKGQK